MLNDILVSPKSHDKHLKFSDHDSDIGEDEDSIKIRLFFYCKDKKLFN